MVGAIGISAMMHGYMVFERGGELLVLFRTWRRNMGKWVSCWSWRIDKTGGVGQRMLAAAANVPVAVMETAGEGGAWGIALLASYLIHKKEEESLASYLADQVFAGKAGSKMEPEREDVAGFELFIEWGEKGL